MLCGLYEDELEISELNKRAIVEGVDKLLGFGAKVSLILERELVFLPELQG
jgi:hypothetical protein